MPPSNINHIGGGTGNANNPVIAAQPPPQPLPEVADQQQLVPIDDDGGALYPVLFTLLFLSI